jgi:hypothetical protein
METHMGGGGASLLTQPHPSRQRKKGLPFLVNNGAEEVTGGNLHQTLQRFDYSSYIKAHRREGRPNLLESLRGQGQGWKHRINTEWDAGNTE